MEARVLIFSKCGEGTERTDEDQEDSKQHKSQPFSATLEVEDGKQNVHHLGEEAEQSPDNAFLELLYQDAEGTYNVEEKANENKSRSKHNYS